MKNPELLAGFLKNQACMDQTTLFALGNCCAVSYQRFFNEARSSSNPSMAVDKPSLKPI